MSEAKLKDKVEKKGYREPNRYEAYDDMLREALAPCRKARRYSGG